MAEGAPDESRRGGTVAGWILYSLGMLAWLRCIWQPDLPLLVAGGTMLLLSGRVLATGRWPHPRALARLIRACLHLPGGSDPASPPGNSTRDKPELPPAKRSPPLL